MSDTPISEMTFEQAMSELERIVTQLESCLLYTSDAADE